MKHQVIGVVSSAAWVGDGINSGLLGLAYPELTSVTNAGESMKYDPFFFSAVKQKKFSHPCWHLSFSAYNLMLMLNRFFYRARPWHSSRYTLTSCRPSSRVPCLRRHRKCTGDFHLCNRPRPGLFSSDAHADYRPPPDAFLLHRRRAEVRVSQQLRSGHGQQQHYHRQRNNAQPRAE